ncbi:hypothetical protein K0M31_020112 [Melipona bicolor]|uniref:Uncharacterized protein n=1 Tax=Melipona bicolor TaxID=60889 RepID=A0AA40G0V0_9HYME|nr:hypothetical protein K0M31_020112 [Melipona bicolor]
MTRQERVHPIQRNTRRSPWIVTPRSEQVELRRVWHGEADEQKVRIEIRKRWRLNEASYTRDGNKITRGRESGVTNEAIVTAETRCCQPICIPPRMSLSGGLASGHVLASVLPV